MACRKGPAPREIPCFTGPSPPPVIGFRYAEGDVTAAAGDSEQFAARVRSAVFWRSGSQIVAQLVMWTSTFLVIRLLEPSDYGLFAITQIVLSLMSLMNGYSFTGALVQADSIDSHRVAQVFGMLILMNFSLA